MLSLINHIVKITMNDGRTLMGKMLAFDRHMNLVLADCEEFRRIKKKRKQGDQEVSESVEQKRTLGLVILRGETIVSLTDEGAPPAADDDKKSSVCQFYFCSGHFANCLGTAHAWTRTRYACRSRHGHDASTYVDSRTFLPECTD